MKKIYNVLATCFVLSCIGLGLMSAFPNASGVLYSGGVAHSGLDKTGGPLSGGNTCSQCHGSGSSATNVNLEIRNASTNALVTSYTGGSSYKIKVTVTNSSYSNFGFQLVALMGSINQSAGSFGSFLTANTQVSSTAGRAYLEHDGDSPTGIFEVFWTAPPAFSGNVNFYYIGNAVNNNGGSGGDQPGLAQSFTLNEQVPTTVNYASTYCTSDVNTTPLVTGNSSGTFSANSGNISVNATTGEIDMTSTTAGTYVITYTYSGGSIDNTVEVIAGYDLTVNATLCDGDSVFLANDWQTTAGVYQDIFSSVDGCDSIVNTDVSILEAPSIDVDTTICQGDSIMADGMWYQSEGVYTQSFQAANGCDSLINYNLILEDYNTQITSGVSTLEVISTDGNTVEFIDCSDSTVIQSDGNMLFEAPYNGEFAVKITGDDCVYYSECLNLTGVGLAENELYNVKVFPNPTTGEVQFTDMPFNEDVELMVLSAQGRTVQKSTIQVENETMKLDLSGLENGVYFVHVKTSDYQIVKRVIKK